ncbi:MAG TPA: pyridoxamine 5'-phosphate oxidase family protein [Acidimicrobiales bacterium]|nr:pyridoxamine 5'-phosphate oxidase family protein [Acidimicrobiales bacterium]
MDVLVVDDSVDIAETTADILRSAGMRARTALSPDEALVALRTSHFDAIVLDHRARSGGGDAILEQCRRREVAVVIVSASMPDELAVLARHNPAVFAVRSKPCDPEDLVSIVRQCITATRRRQGEEPKDEDDRAAASRRGGLVIDELDAEACRALLERVPIGRVGVVVDNRAVILPVNFVIVDHAVVFRSTPGTKISKALHKADVTFQVDDYDPNGDRGWSVLVHGPASVVVDIDRMASLARLPLRPISPKGLEDEFVQIPIASMSGRRVRPRYRSETGPTG